MNSSHHRYLISESLELRQAIKEKYGKDRTIITDVSTVIQHMNCKQFKDTDCDPKGTADHALQLAVGQLWVFSATEIQARYSYHLYK